MVEKTTNKKLEIINLYRTNYLSQYHIREMAKLLQKNHVTLLPHLKSLENDKILTSKTIGKNKVYSLNLDNILTKEYLVIAEKLQTITYLEEVFLIKKISTEIFNLNLKGTMILFGSYAKKTYKKDSDIDLFYLGDDKKVIEIKKIGKTYGKTINVKKSTNFTAALRKKEALVQEVIKFHLILHNSEPFIDTLWRYYNEIK